MATADNKIEKGAAGYICEPESDYLCSQCTFYFSGECSYFVKSDKKVASYGSCNYFNFGEPASLEGPGSRTKEESGYAENPSKVGYACRRCEYFSPEYHLCEKVKGAIGPKCCCNLWERDSFRGTLSRSALTQIKNLR